MIYARQQLSTMKMLWGAFKVLIGWDVISLRSLTRLYTYQ